MPSCFVGAAIDALIESAQEARADIVVGGLDVAPAVFAASAPVRVIDDQNVETVRYRRLARQERAGLRKLARRLDAWEMHRYEKRWLLCSDGISLCSEVDALAMAAEYNLPRQKLKVIANGADTTNVPCWRSRRKEIVYVGSMAYAPNIEAATELVQEIMPLVWNRQPDVRLILVGKDPVQEVLDLADDRVTITGAVDSTEPYLESCALTVVPLRSGGGTRLKITQAMAVGTPIVATSLAVEGLPVADGVHLLLRDSPADIATAVVSLLESQSLQADLSQNARQLARESFDWASIGDEMSVWLEQVSKAGNRTT